MDVLNKLKEWEVNSNTTDMNLKTICMEIDNGNINEGGINLKPFYQREYKFTRKDESLLIESLLAGIPIPTIYLASDTSKIPHVSNVIDGQHRLYSVYRFLNGKFKLTDLAKYKSLNGLKFNELAPEIQNKLYYQVSLTLQFIHVQNNPELEIEIFTRYNKGTNPLTQQEIRNVVYGSKFNDWIAETVDKLKDDEVDKEIFNVANARYRDKSNHGELHVLFAIFKHGIKEEFYSSTEYIEMFMKETSREMDNNEIMLFKQRCEEYFNSLKSFMRKAYYEKGIKYPFSKEIYSQTERRNHKFQTSIMMVIAPVYNYLLEKNWDMENEGNLAAIREAIKKGFLNSDFPTDRNSTTRPALLLSTINTIQREIDNLVLV
ncbi:DUF262 domain-containing protein [Priestia megaterium]|uniref:DUF262 domain-containing protein n=1 Tax=Priestia megaterium TaxID=1404 RepID=UPI00272FFD9E|nr:DUF262 domain-containing protein [Priestia megaterium]MDP1471884.1 DUF262 domain-containing protein [Priestia megaterium]